VGIFRQSQRDERLLVLPVPAVRHDQQVRRIEINDPAVQDGGLSPWMHHPSAVTAHAKVDLGHGGPHIHRSPPVHQLIGVGERTENPVDIGLEYPLQPNRVSTTAHYCSSDR
jgi:hypothetical protein